MIDSGRPAALTRRRFLTLAAAAAAGPVVGGCAAVRAGSRPVPALRPRGGTTQAVDAYVGGVRAQVHTPLGTNDGSVAGLGLGSPADLGLVRGDSLLVLSYHNVTADGLRQGTGQLDPYTVSAAQFAAQIDMLRRSGFRSIRVGELLHAQRNRRRLPPGSMLITFDDGVAGQWIYADPVLAAAGFSAAAFVITAHLGSSPGHLRWAEVAALAGSGRWDIGAHTHDQHHLVATGQSSAPASVLINRGWDPTTRTLQSAPAARAAFAADLDTCLAMFARAGIARPASFAYPFSQVGSPTNDVEFAGYVQGQLAASFPLLLTNTTPGRLARREDLAAGILPRLEVRHGTSALNLFERIRAADTIAGRERIPGAPVGG